MKLPWLLEPAVRAVFPDPKCSLVLFKIGEINQNFENKLIVVIDEILPMRTHFNDVIIQPPVRLLSTN